MKEEILDSNKLDDHTFTNFLKFIVPSLLGVGLFLIPVEFQGKMTVVLGMLAELIKSAIGDGMGLVATFIFVSSAILSLYYSLFPESWTARTPYLLATFKTTTIWLYLRVLGGIFSVMILLQIGPEWAIGDATGVTAYVDVAGIIFCLIGIGCFLLPLLTDYGFLEYVGTLLRSVFQKVFGLPGRSTIDALASWVAHLALQC